ncbi:N-carbamoyl-L-amino acid hydrolase [Pragia fontium]|uniref:Zn-dependent hydrolase n=1 Tax=Pragia fontium TaxID=82985 RepID=UPI000E043159|nr:Zn-dependent hydrolase [Pragia fontium]SUB81415.1 N-carbamoyl-L-amino acid hydrolase [Pragia fontium]
MTYANTDRIQRHLEQIATFTATPGQGTTRMSYSEQGQQAREYIKAQMLAVGLTVREDAIGNIFGKLVGQDATLPSVMIGSHFDSVPNGGAFDGPAGVVMGLEIATLFHEHKLTPHYPLEVVALVEEEGASFGRGLLASCAIAGKVSADELHTLRDAQGISAAARMADVGFNADDVSSVIRSPDSLKAFIELHIEQGPVLEQHGTDIGLVDVIVGITQLVVTISGKAGHAGTTPMDNRQDALVVASRVVSQVGDFARQAGEATVATVGKLQVFPNGANVIPNKVVFTVDIRSKSEEKLNQVIALTKDCIQQNSGEGITVQVEQPLYVSPTPLNPELHQRLQKHSDQLGLSSRTMVSGAGHDAMIFAGITDVGLVFVPSRNGLSHHPDEWTDYEQIQKGVDVIFHTVKEITEATQHD